MDHLEEVLETESGIIPIGLCITRRFDKGPPQFIVLNPGEHCSVTHWTMRLQKLSRSWPACFVSPRGVFSQWTAKSPPNYVERSHALLGRTVDEGRVWDIVAAIRYGVSNERPNCKVIGRGQAGILAAYAALFEPSIKEVVIVDPPTSHRSGPIFLNVLRVLDIPEALGLLAPGVKLTLINAKDKAFDRTADLQTRRRKDKFERK